MELAALDAMLDRIGDGAAGVRFEGEPGIGKSTVWREGIRRAADRGIGVLVARPSEVETGYAYAGLGDLLAEVDDAILMRIPEPQRLVVRAALLLSQAPGGAIDERTVGAGLLSTLRVLAEEQPRLIAVDDVQWLDLPSARALAFAARRLRGERIGICVTARPGGETRRSFDRSLPQERLVELSLGPLSIGALHLLFKQQLGRSFPRPTLARIARACAGNPLYALEIARELERVRHVGPSLPVPAALGALVEARVARLTSATRAALLAAASQSHPTVERTGDVDLQPAVRAGIVHIEDGSVRFAHPLYAAAVYQLAGDESRRAMHRELAAIAADPEERARHLALAASGPDAAVAAALEEAADGAAARGAPSAATELLELALRRTPPHDSAAVLRRTVALTRRLLDAGEGARAEGLLRQLLETAAPGPFRQEAKVQLGWWLQERGDWAPGIALLEAALGEAGDARTAGRTGLLLAQIYRLDLPRTREHARRALEHLDPAVDPGLYSKALQLSVEARLLSGDGLDHEGMARALELQQKASGTRMGWEMSQYSGALLRGMDDLDGARSIFEGLIRAYEERGFESELAAALAHLATIELWSGRWQRAEELARRASELSDEVGYVVPACLARYALGLVLAQRGETREAQAAAEETLALFVGRPAGILETQAHVVLGQTHLATGDAAEAIRHFAQADELLARIGWHEPFHFRYHGDQIEALIEAGRVAEADAVVRRVEASAARVPRPWIAAVAARGRALVRAVEGDIDGAADSFARALAAHGQALGPFERGRTLLAQGRFLRRTKQKRLSRAAFTEALEIFEEQGARLWAEQTRAELGRVAFRTRSADLTDTELLIAGLASTGLTNEAIAARAFVSPKTVEANLARAYQKLGIRRRAQLARALDDPGHITAS